MVAAVIGSGRGGPDCQVAPTSSFRTSVEFKADVLEMTPPATIMQFVFDTGLFFSTHALWAFLPVISGGPWVQFDPPWTSR